MITDYESDPHTSAEEDIYINGYKRENLLDHVKLVNTAPVTDGIIINFSVSTA